MDKMTLRLIMVVLVVGCSGANERISPSKMAKARIESVAKSHIDDQIYTLRLNPAPCDCPPFEVILDGKAYRVYLEPEGTNTLVSQLRASLEEDMNRGIDNSTVKVNGKLSKGVRLAPNRNPCLVLTITSVVERGKEDHDKTD